MTLVTFFFFAHQPYRLRPYSQRPVGQQVPAGELERFFFDVEMDRGIFQRAAERCYYPASKLLLELVRQHQGGEKPFKFAFGLSGTFLDQAAAYEPGLIPLLQELAATGMVEFTGETYYHSLASLFEGDRREFRDQAHLQADAIEKLFGQRPTVFRNTECLYNNTIADVVLNLGYDGIITEGVDWLMEGWRSPDYVYRSSSGLPVLLRNYNLSDDIGYRFPNKSWEHWPLRAETFAEWLSHDQGMDVLLAMDYEAFGEHIPAEAGIFDFLRALPEAILKYPQLEFSTPSESVRRLPSQGVVLVNDFATISWADKERDTSAWLGNEMQQFAFEEIKRMEMLMRATEDPEFLRVWRLLQTSDHLYYLSEKALSDGDVHQYFSAYGSIFEGFVRLQTALSDLEHRAERAAG